MKDQTTNRYLAKTKKKLTLEQERELVQSLRKEGKTLREIAAHCGVKSLTWVRVRLVVKR